MSNLLYCVGDLLYGKEYDFLIYLFLTNVFVLIFMRYLRLASFFIVGFIIMSFLKIKYDYFGLDISHTLNKTSLYDTWKYVVFITVCIYLFSFGLLLSKRMDLVIRNFIKNNQELLETKIREKQLEKNKETFFATISHEIRTPLNAIKGILDLLKAHEKEKDFDPSLFEIMNNSSNHLLSLVNNFLDFSKLNEGKFTLNYSVFDLKENLNFIFKMNEALALEKKINYKLTRVGQEIPKNFYADKNRLNQIVLNILNNAVKYTNTGSVEMQYSCEKNENIDFTYDLKINIIDTGVGIAKESTTKIFETYTNLSGKNDNSVGLGLSISKGLTELMGGTISVESEFGKGSVFSIYIPLKVSNETTEVSSNHLAVPTIIDKKLKILVVDDNQINLMIISKQLEIAIVEPQIHTANDGIEAIEKLKTNNYDLILMDLMMPNLGGIATTKIIRNDNNELTKNTPIIALSANVEENSINECFESGMNNYLSKPFDIKDLLQKINAIIGTTH
jgi:signal transduction histidine kinase/ActR/RegA family two-component response regulator